MLRTQANTDEDLQALSPLLAQVTSCAAVLGCLRLTARLTLQSDGLHVGPDLRRR